MTIFASIIMFTGYQFKTGNFELEHSKLEMFKFFTVDSNLLMGATSLVFSVSELSVLKRAKEKVNVKFYALKLMATVSVSITFLTVFGYLGHIAKGGIASMLTNANLFFHLLIPMISVLTFIFFEKTTELKMRYSLLGTLPTIIYAIFYLINIIIHVEDGKVSPLYDWYWFVQGGLWQTFIVLPLMIGISYVISLILWYFNRKQ